MIRRQRLQRNNHTPKRMKLRTRLTVIFGLGALLLSIFLASMTYFTARHYIISQRATSDIHQTFANASLVLTSLRSSDAKASAIIDTIGTAPGARSILTIHHHWYATSISVGEDSLPQDFKHMVVTGKPADQIFMVSGTPEFGVGIPLPSVKASYFEIFSLSDLNSVFKVLLLVLAVTTLLTALAGAATGRWVASRVLRSLVTTSEAAVGIAGGNLDTRLETTGDSDLDPLFESFNQMADSLSRRIEREARFTSDVSHELRSPLTTLATTAEILKNHADNMPERSRQALDMLIAEVDRFQQMVKELLEISAMDAGAAVPNIESTNAATLMRHLSNTFVPPGIAVNIAPELENLEIFVDRHRVERVFANLVDNANQHSDGLSKISATRNGDYIRISVTDKGPSIPADQHQAIFERFYRGKAAGRRGKSTGTGLGLALVLEHVKLHQGTVSVEATDNGGNTFIVEIPIRPSSAYDENNYFDGSSSVDGGLAGTSGDGVGGGADGIGDSVGGGSDSAVGGVNGSDSRATSGSRATSKTKKSTAGSKKMGNKRTVLKIAAIGLSALLLGSCAVITQNKPTALSRRSIPFGLMDKTPNSFPIPQKRAPVEVPATIFLVAPDGRLWPASRDIAFPSSIDSLLTALVDGPTKPEALYGLSTAIPAQAGSLSAKITGSTAVVNLAPTFGTLSGPAQIEATAQIVFTVTTLPGVTDVTFRMNGAVIDVPNALGALLPGPVNRSDYTPLAPLPPPAPTTAHTPVAAHPSATTHSTSS